MNYVFQDVLTLASAFLGRFCSYGIVAGAFLKVISVWGYLGTTPAWPHDWHTLDIESKGPTAYKNCWPGTDLV